MDFGLVRKRLLARIKNLGSTDGLAITEYGLLVALVAIVLIAVVAVLGGGLSSWFGTKTGQITTF